MSKRWYEKETPIRAQAGPVEVRYYDKAGRLQFATFKNDPITGEEKPGLTFTLRATDLARSEAACELWDTFAQRAREMELVS